MFTTAISAMLSHFIPARYNPVQALTFVSGLLIAGSLFGCGGGQDFGSLQRSLGGDIANGYNTSLGGRSGSNGGSTTSGIIRGTYPKIETSFELPGLPGDPYDYEKVNVQVLLHKPDGSTVEVPAFFDGGATWRMRYTPSTPGPYAVASVKLNHETAHEEKLATKDWTVKGETEPGFIRIDRGDHARLVFDNGERYYPMGNNAAWKNQDAPDIPDLFTKMHAAGENWSRVWMNDWDGKNLDGSLGSKPAKLGDIDLKAAQRWDSILEAADKNAIYFQFVVQHHGQYSTKTNPNWATNPYNAANGGFLKSPEDFFSDPQARALTRRKLYYIVARWGYSPNILAFELFNEVQFTDSGSARRWDDIALWHREMAIFLRQIDPNRHLLTTSAAPGVPLDNPIWDTVDLVQTHLYPVDILSALGPAETTDGKKQDKPGFVGEFGPQQLKDTEGVFLHVGLWASLFSGRTGAAQYWDWDNIDKNALYGNFRAARDFLTASSLVEHSNLPAVYVPVESTQRGDLAFGPGGGFDAATRTDFVVGSSAPPGMDKFPSYLQGKNHKDMLPGPLTFHVSYPQAGTFTLELNRIAQLGAQVLVQVDGKGIQHDFPADAKDYSPSTEQGTFQLDVPAGSHAITIQNTGVDWVQIHQFRFSNYTSALSAIARIGRDYGAAWIYNRSAVNAASKSKNAATATGRLVFKGLQPGRYHVTWWDTHAGKSLDASDLTLTGKEELSLQTPPIESDMAVYVERADVPAGKSGGKRGKVDKQASSNPAPSVPDTTAPPAPPPGANSP